MTEHAELAAGLRAIVGETHVLVRRTELMVYESDGLPGYRKRPRVAVFPGSRDEVVAVVRLLARERVPFVPRGAGTGLSGGALADDIVLLGLHRLKRIVHIDANTRRAVVEPGVVNAWLSAAALPHGLHYAPDPSSQSACTIGGNIAENAGGPHCLKYGVTLNHVVGATVVLPSGEIVTLKTPEHAGEGFDLLGAFIGSEGCFGVALDITVRLTPNPPAVRTLLADFTSIDDAARTTSAIVASGIVPAACELMDQGTILAVEASVYAAGYPMDAAAVLLVELDGAPEGVEQDTSVVEALCNTHGARSVRIAIDPADRARLWQGRKKAFGAMGRMAPNLAVQDAVVPRTRLAEILAGIAEIATRHGVRVCNVFHAGDGNLHPNVPYDGRDPDEAKRVHTAMREIMSLCIAAGGTITGEHGVGLDKLDYMEELFTADTLDGMCRLRGVFDPDRRANPGKTIPVHSCREWHGIGEFHAAASAVPLPRRATPRGVPEGARIADALRDSARRGAAVYLAGAGTYVDAPAGTPALDVRACAGVIEYVPDDLTITVGAGMTLRELDAITAGHRQWCPLFPWGRDDATIGGVLASARRGPANGAFGSPRDLTLGLTFVDGRGAIISAGGRVVKNVAGFDLVRTLIGSWGTLGVILTASLRLRALPSTSETWLVPADDAHTHAFETFVRGEYAPVAHAPVHAALARQLGAAAGPGYAVRIAGNAAHVRAARAALVARGHAQQLDDGAWATIRSSSAHARIDTAVGQHTVVTTPGDDALIMLNARVREAFDPHGVFTSPVMTRTQELISG